MTESLLNRLVHAYWILLPLLLASCTTERPSDLRLERVYVADLSATPSYKARVAEGMPPLPLRLAIELSTSEIFPLGASIVDGFCGEKKGPGYLGDGNLYRATGPSGKSASGSSVRDQPDRNRYLVFVAIAAKPNRLCPECANFDLKDDSRDLCLHTGAGTYADVWSSNEVRVPRSLIGKAFNEPPRTDFPLGPDLLP